MLAQKPDGTWSCFEFVEVVARQNGKGGLYEARHLAGLFLVPTDVTLIHSAHEAKTSKEAFFRLKTLIGNTPQLAKRVANFYQSNENIAIHLHPRAGVTKRLRFVTRTKGGGRGFTADFVGFDEAYELDSGPLAALVPTLQARINPQIVYASSAGLSHSQHLHELRRRAVDRPEQEDSLGYCEYSPDADAEDFDPNSDQAIADANPALGIRLTMERTRKLQRTLASTKGAFEREVLTIFDPDHSAAGRVIPEASWTNRKHEDATMAGQVVLGVAVSLDGQWASVSTAGRCEKGHRMLEVIETKPGTGWVPAFVKTMREKHSDIVATGLNDNGPAAELKVAFTEAGIKFEAVSSKDYASYCQTFMSATVDEARTPDQHICHLDDARLNNAVANVQKRGLGDGFAWKRAATDVSSLEAATVALGLLLTLPEDTTESELDEDRGFLTL